MSEVRPMSSIASRINRSYIARLFWIFLRLDLFIILLGVFIFVYSSEKISLGNDWQFKLERQVEWSTDSELPLSERLDSISYSFSLPEADKSYTIAAGEMARPFYYGLLIVGGSQILTLLVQYFRGKKRTRYLLEPLRQIGQTAEELSRANFEVQKYHNLESAIDEISPLSPGARLSTGDRELGGLESAINNLLGRMHDSYRQQTRFVSDASHELRTPIAVVQGYADMLARWGSKDEKILQESIDAIQSESRHMQKLVEQLLFLARGDTGRNELQFRLLDLSDMIREVRDEYSMIKETHVWTLKEMTPITAFGDLSMLKQCARVLCDNAARYSEPGSEIVLGTSVSEDGEPCFEIRDNGQGIPEPDIKRIFDRFYRSDPARARANGGTGLGLSIAKWIVDQHEGYFKVISLEGVGTRINVCLPPAEKLQARLAPVLPAVVEEE